MQHIYVRRVQWTERKSLSESSSELRITIPSSFPDASHQRRCTITSYFDERACDDPISDPKHYQVECYNVMVDVFENEMRCRFVLQKQFKEDFGILFNLQQNSREIDELLSACQKVKDAIGRNIINANKLSCLLTDEKISKQNNIL